MAQEDLLREWRRRAGARRIDGLHGVAARCEEGSHDLAGSAERGIEERGIEERGIEERGIEERGTAASGIAERSRGRAVSAGGTPHGLIRRFWTGLHDLRSRLPLDCLLCARRCAGGLCEYCRAVVCETMHSGGPRCSRCDVVLDAGERLRCGALLAGEPLITPVGTAALGADAGVAALGADAGTAALGADTGATASGTGAFVCSDCLFSPPAFDRVVAAFDYDWPGDLLIQRLKLHGRYVCAPLLAGVLVDRVRAEDVLTEGAHASNGDNCGIVSGAASHWVTAVPSSRRSLVLRGYNPAVEVGRAFARRLGLPWKPGLLRRTHEGRDQKWLGRSARQRSVEALYECAGEVVGRRIVVVDDVMTTGSTLSAIADALTRAGAARVYGAVLARTPRLRRHEYEAR